MLLLLQAELDATAADLKHTEQLLGSTELVLDR
jgi:hypothetical protein